MKQTISNACGTVALIHAIANNADKLDLGSGYIREFLDATKDCSPEERAKKLEEYNDICAVHDTIAKEGQTAVRRGLFCTY